MITAVLAFPDALDRSDREFLRTGSTLWLRAMDEAEDLAEAIAWGADDHATLAKRIDQLHAENTDLATYRPADLETEVVLCVGGAGRTARVTLRDAPMFLNAMLAAWIAPRRLSGRPLHATLALVRG